MILVFSKRLIGDDLTTTLNDPSLKGKIAVDHGFRSSLVGRMLGTITRTTASRVYYETRYNERAIRETFADKHSVGFVVDTEQEYHALVGYDERRMQRLDDAATKERGYFKDHISLYNTTGKGLE